MWAYIAAYEMPHDDGEALLRRTHFNYPAVIDRVLGLGKLPSMRLQCALARPGRLRLGDRILVWTHWAWFLVPHCSLAYVLLWHRERFSRSAALTYAVYDIGVMFYWLIPTAPPWYAASAGRLHSDGNEMNPTLRRMMVEYGEEFWRDGWGPMFSVLGGNPLAAMPSQHFATSLNAALVLADTGPIAGAIGSAYAASLGFALVYLGEHYVADLLAGAALVFAVRRAEPLAAPPLRMVSRAVATLERAATA